MNDTGGIDRRIGDSIRAARVERRLTTRQLADLAGISQPTLSNIENARVRAGVATLYQLAEALGLPPARFLADDGSGARDDHDESAHGGRLRALPASPEARLETYEMTVPAGHAEDRTFQHAGEDVIYVVAGRGDLTLGERTLPLRAGDILWIDATSPHRFRAADSEPLVAQVVTARTGRHPDLDSDN